jgi:hypothetical protein
MMVGILQSQVTMGSAITSCFADNASQSPRERLMARPTRYAHNFIIGHIVLEKPAETFAVNLRISTLFPRAASMRQSLPGQLRRSDAGRGDRRSSENKVRTVRHDKAARVSRVRACLNVGSLLQNDSGKCCLFLHEQSMSVGTASVSRPVTGHKWHLIGHPFTGWISSAAAAAPRVFPLVGT